MLVIGAGITGLTAAVELSRLGVPVRVIDKLPGPAAGPKNLVIQAWTAKLLEQRGLSPETLPASNRVTHAAVYRAGGLVGTVELGAAELAPGGDHRGHALLVGQAELERILRERLARHDVVVEYGAELVTLVQAKPGRRGQPGEPAVTALVRHPGGRLEDIIASYLISADGVPGTTSHLLNGPAHRKQDRCPYVLADLRLDGNLRGDVISVFLGRSGFVMLLPAGRGRFQCIATDSSARSGDQGGPGMAELQQLMATCLPAHVRPREMRWSSRFVADRRPSPPMRHGRVFFGGDSAYAYSPAMGLGANSGIGDMVNLSWKLAMVLQGKAAPDLLATYAEERLQAISQLERRAEAFLHPHGAGRGLSRKLVTPIGPALLGSPNLLDLYADLAGEVIPDYWSSPLSAPPRGPGSLEPGGSIPDLRIVMGDLSGSRPRLLRLHQLVSPSRLTLLLTDDTGSAVPSAGLDQLLPPWRELMAVRLVTPAPGHEERLGFSRAFGGRSLVVVRPDAHVSFTAGPNDLPRLITWLNTWFPPGSTGTAPVRRRQLAGWLHRV